MWQTSAFLFRLYFNNFEICSVFVRLLLVSLFGEKFTAAKMISFSSFYSKWVPHRTFLTCQLCSESNCIWMQLKISVFDESTKRSSWTSRGMIFCFFVPDSKVCLGSPETEWSSWPWCWAATSFRPAFQVGLGILVWPQKARAEWLCQEWLRLSHILGTWVMTKTCKAVSLPWGFLETRIEAE